MYHKCVRILPFLPVLLVTGLLAPVGCSSQDQIEDRPIVVMSGQEDTSARMHILALNVDPPESSGIEAEVQPRIDQINNVGGLAVVTLSELTHSEYIKELKSLTGYSGIELYDTSSNFIWDALLSDRVSRDEPLIWGFMGDDLHYPFQLGFGFIMLKASEPAEANILDSLKSGSFYWGNTPVITDISLDKNKIRVKLLTEANIKFIKSQGETAAEVFGDEASYEISGDEGYIRAEVETASGKMAGTQPFRVKNADLIENPYALKGFWFKGNLHTHSTDSDGQLSPEDVIGLYDEKDYDFLAITDHVQWTIPADASANGQ